MTRLSVAVGFVAAALTVAFADRSPQDPANHQTVFRASADLVTVDARCAAARAS